MSEKFPERFRQTQEKHRELNPFNPTEAQDFKADSRLEYKNRLQKMIKQIQEGNRPAQRDLGESEG